MVLKTLLIAALGSVLHAEITPTALGLFRDGQWFMDTNGNGSLDSSDRVFADFGDAGDLPVTGDWNGDGRIDVGVFRAAIATWYLDYNGNGIWDGAGADRVYQFGTVWHPYPSDRPVVGDWNGDGRTDIGVVKGCGPNLPVGTCLNMRWELDVNGDGIFGVGDSSDLFGLRSDHPVTGDWNGDGRTDIGSYRNGTWFLDNGNGVWNPGVDPVIQDFGDAGDLPVAGDWTGDGIVKVGVFRPSANSWYLDTNGNGLWDPLSDRTVSGYGTATDIPVTGRWLIRRLAGRLGYFSNGQWRFDTNDNGIYDGPPVDRFNAGFGLNVDQPFYGDWNNDGTLEIGVFRGGPWFLDYNSNGQWDPGIDRTYFFGLGSDMPIVGDWNGDGQTDIGVFRPSEVTFFLDYNGNGTWDAGDRSYSFGAPSDIPVAGDWNGDGRAKIGVFRNGFWILDTNGNGTLDAGDRTIANFGAPGDLPVAGDWGGTGRSKIGVYRRGDWFLDSNDSGTFDLADRIVSSLGSFTDKPFIWGLVVAP